MNRSIKSALSALSLWIKIPELSLRNRIALYYTASTALLIAIVFMVIYFMVDSIVYKQFDERLKTEVVETLSKLHLSTSDFPGITSLQDIDNNEHEKDKEYKKQGIENIDLDKHLNERKKEHREKKLNNIDTQFIQLVDSKGEVIKKSSSLSWCVLSFDPSKSGQSYFNSSFGKSMGFEDAMVRQAQIPLVNRNGINEGYLIIAMPLKNTIIVLHDLRNTFIFSFPAIIFTLFILTRLIAGKSIHPIEKIIATAEKLTQTNLHERIDLPFHHDELYRLSATINALLNRMQDAFNREKQFTADASHELKTPLAAIKGTLEVLIRKPRDREHYESRIQFCLMELNRMARLIDQLLLLARYESNKMKPNIETIILSSHLDDVIARIKPVALVKNICITADLSEKARVTADPVMLEMIFENILSNAIKYSPEDSSITLTAECIGNTIVCTIADQGFGIPEEKLQAIFERFYRLDESRSSATGGFGLGLSIVKKLTDLLDIKVSLQSTRDKGTTFTLTFQSV
ncbi:MAG: ATP-binding protein [Chlorobiaceae bacterium]